MARKVKVNKLEPNPWNPNEFTEEKFKRLKRSIELTDGNYLRDNPILVRPLQDGEFQIVDGEHRYRACRELGIEEIPVRVQDMSKEKAMELSVVLNKNRGDINYFKLSKTLNELYKPYSRDGMSQAKLGKKFGFSRSAIAGILPIYPRLKKCLHADTFSNRQLQEMARVKNDKLRRILVERVKERDWKSNTIRSRATRFNKLTKFLEGEVSDKELRKEILNALIDDLGESLLNYDYSALRNEAKALLKKERKKRIIHGDMFEEVPELDRQFDCVIADPPYNVSNERTYSLEGRKDMTTEFGEWDHFSKEEYLTFTERWLETVKPKLKGGGSLLIFTADVFLSYLISLLREQGFRDRNTIIWYKKNPRPSVEQNNFVSSVEYIHYATKGKPKTFNWMGQNESHNLLHYGVAKDPVHPTQKPVKLLKKLLKFVTNTGDWVLDPFAGSGATAVACNELNRNWTMIEKQEEFVHTIERRVK